MKKIVLATVLAVSTATFAGYKSNFYQGGYQGGGYQGGYQAQKLTVKQALSARDNSMVSLVGRITQQIDNDDFLFSDGTAQIKIDVKNRAWNGLNIGPNDKVRIYGKLDNDAYEYPEIKVYNIEKVR